LLLFNWSLTVACSIYNSMTITRAVGRGNATFFSELLYKNKLL